MRVLQAVLFSFLSGIVMPAAAQAQAQAGTAPQVSLVTFAPGEIYWQRFGHNALVVRDGSGDSQLYNYGIFDFRQKNFFLNFARGRMLYRLDAMPVDEALYGYAREGRWAREQGLNLAPEQAKALAAFLAWNAQPENAEYRYDYFNTNCSTQVRDAIDRALGGVLRQQLEARPAGRSLRFEATRLIRPHLALSLGMDLGMGPRADAPLNLWQQSFVPMVLMEALRGVRVQGAPLVAYERWLLQANSIEPPTAPRDDTGLFALGGILFAVLLLGLGRRSEGRASLRAASAGIAVVLGLLMGLGGLMLALGGSLTEHWVMQANRNLLLLNPLLLLLLPALWRSRDRRYHASRAVRGLTTIVLTGALCVPLLALLPGQAQQQLQWIVLWLPLNLVLGWRLLRTARASGRN